MIGDDAPRAVAGQRIVAGPDRVRHELHWQIALPDGRRAVLAQLVPELAAEPALRRRWAHDVERLSATGAPALAETLAIGPAPDPRDPAAEAPWRVRLEPAGRRLDDWLGGDGARRPVDEVVEVVAAIADAVAGVHSAGAVLRDLEPRAIVVSDAGAVTLTDVGLARLGILSSRTASTLAMESSPWAAPEHLRSTVVDARADVYTLGVILHRALTGVLPATEGVGPLRQAIAVGSLAALRPEIPAALDELVRRCLAGSPEDRPATVGEVAAALRGRGAGALAIVLTACQACGAALRTGMRLCLSCGKEAVQVPHTPVDRGGRFALVLEKVGEKVEHTAALRGLYETFAAEVPSLNFLIGDERYYSKEERESLHRLPAKLFDQVSEEGARTLAARVQAKGLKTQVVDLTKVRRRRKVAGWSIPAGVALAITALVALLTGSIVGVAGALMLFGGVAAAIAGGVYVGTTRGLDRQPLARLRAAPAALPAADPLVARLAVLLPDVRSPDVRDRVAEMALWLQRIADHRARLAGAAAQERGPAGPSYGSGAAAAEVAAVLEPVSLLVDATATQVRALIALDADLAALDEGALVRALAAAEARNEPASRRAELLAGLDRLRSLEDRRAALIGRLLEAGVLLRRAADLVLSEGADTQADEAEVSRAMALLESGT